MIRRWTMGIMVPQDDDCPVCGEKMDDYTIIVHYPEGDRVDITGIIYHSKCIKVKLKI
jgi:hypothetical protein